jgi:DNA polymerase beta
MDKFVTRSPPDTKSNPKKRKADEIATSDDEGSGSAVKETKKIILKNKGPAPKKQKTSNKSEVLELQPSLHENFNEDITKILLELGNIEKNKGELYRYKAYVTAANSLKAHPHKITSGKEAKKLPGIGAKIAKKIDEILETGVLAKLEKENNDEHIKALNLLSRITGVGPALAKKLVFEEGVRTLEDLKEKKIKLTHHQQIGLKYFDDFEKRVPREEIKKLKDIVIEVAKEVDENIVAKCCGSYRRKLPSSGDVDVLLTHPDYTYEHKQKGKAIPIIDKIIKKLKQRKFLIDDLSQGPSKYMGVCRLDEDHLARRIDIKLFPTESFYPGLIHFTGSGEFNRQLRVVALKKGYTLSEYGIFPVGTTGEVGDPIPVGSEEEVFEILDVPYKKPQERSY